MRFPRTIAFRIALGFGLLVIAIFLAALVSHRCVSRLQSTREKLHTVLEPSLLDLTELQNILLDSRELLESGFKAGSNGEPALLPCLERLLQTRLPGIHRQILRLSDDWDPGSRESYLNLSSYISDSLSEPSIQWAGGLFPGQADSSRFKELISAYEYAGRQLGTLVVSFDSRVSRASSEAETVSRETGNILLVTGLVIALVSILTAGLLYLSLARPIKMYGETITSMGKGVVPDRNFREGPDELGRIGTALNNMIRGYKEISEFAEEIGKGNFKSEFSPQSEQDILGNSLIRLRESLKNAAIEEEKRKREDERRHWSNHGIARFSEIMREFSGDSRTLAGRLISELVKYLGAKVGGIFLISREEASRGDIELVASYAYDRAKYLEKTIKPGEGLVGRCVQEGNTIFLTDIPPDYVKIKSGLGEDNPRSLLIVPIRFNEQITGVIEIASLEIFQDFQIEFVERIGSSIASSLSRDQPGNAG